MNYRDGMESYDLELPAFDRAISELNTDERGPARWTIGAGAFMFNSTIQSQFPVVARVLDGDGNPTASHLDPDQVATKLMSVFDGA